MKKIFPFDFVEGVHQDIGIRFYYRILANNTCDLYRGNLKTESSLKVGDSPISTRKTKFKTKSSHDYFFIGFLLTPTTSIKKYKIGENLMDLMPLDIDSGSLNLILINEQDKIIFGSGVIDFLRKKVYLDLFKHYPIEIISFKNRKEPKC